MSIQRIDEIVERAYDDYCNGDTYPIRDAFRQVAREAWNAASIDLYEQTQAEQQENGRRSAVIQAAQVWAEKGKTAINDEPTDALIRAIFNFNDLEEDGDA